MPDVRHVPILLIDIAGFTVYTDVPRRRAVLRDLLALLTASARFFMPYGDPWAKWTRPPTGDGYYFVFDGLPPAVALEYALQLGEALGAREKEATDLPLRLRQVLTIGDVETVDDQHLSDAFAEAERFISDSAFKRYAKERSEPWALAMTDLFHHELRNPATAAAAGAASFPRHEALRWTPIEVVDKHGQRRKGYVEGPGWQPPPAPPEQPEPVPPAAPAVALRRIWLGRLEREHRSLTPYFDLRGAPLLEHVYVELELDRRSLRESAAEHHSMERLHGPLTIQEVLALDPSEHRWVTRRWLLKGDPGSGKTTLLRHLAHTLAMDTGGEALVPVFASLPRCIREKRWLFDRIAADLTREGLPGADIRKALEERAASGRLLLLLDGLDEVPRDLREEAESLLGALSSRWPSSPIVVSTRPIGVSVPGPEFRELEILPFDERRSRELLAHWFGHDGPPDTERAAAVAESLMADANLRELASNPLYLTLIAFLVEEGAEPARQRPKLYDQIFDLLEEGRHHRPPTPIDSRELAHAALARLAYSMTEENRDAESAPALERRLQSDPASCSELKLSWPSLRGFLGDIAEKTGILASYDGPDSDWRFWHRTFREALAAEALAGAYRSGGRVALVEHARGLKGDLGRWGEPYALLTGRIDEPDALVKALVEANPALGLRALATAEGLKEATLRDVLALTESWEERREVYARIPELLGEPRSALALIDQLRRQWRKGEDLYFLEQAIDAVAARWPDAARLAEDHRRRFFDHIPRAPADLFRFVEAPAGRLPLWREIPAGEFQMGSPSDEEGRYPHEGPRHRVTIRRPFGMAVVPVTNAQYAAFDPAGGHRWEGAPEADELRFPVVGITWYAAMAFCRWLATLVPGARLPTEAEWEYACRAGTETAIYTGPLKILAASNAPALDPIAWYGGNSGVEYAGGVPSSNWSEMQRPAARSGPHPVALKQPNAWGLYDMLGNASEWTLSPGSDDYSGREAGVEHDPGDSAAPDLAAARAASASAPAAARRVIRGGGFRFDAQGVRSAYRFHWYPAFEFVRQGFRVALSGPPSA